MPYCPKCQSSDVCSNHIEDETMRNVLHAGHAAHRAGFHAVTWGAMTVAEGMKLVNRCRKAWRCRACGYRFDD